MISQFARDRLYSHPLFFCLTIDEKCHEMAENLMNTDHKVANEACRDGYDFVTIVEEVGREEGAEDGE